MEDHSHNSHGPALAPIARKKSWATYGLGNLRRSISQDAVPGQVCSKPNPYTTANILSRETHHFLGGILSTGAKRPLQSEDLFEVDASDDSENLMYRLRTEWAGEAKREKPSLLRALVRTFGKAYLVAGALLVVQWGAGLLEPLWVAHFIEAFGDDTDDGTDAWMYAGLFIGCSFLRAFLAHPYFYRGTHLGMQCRVACVGMVYEKLLRLSSEALTSTGTGHLVNLISNDTERFDQAVPYIHFLWLVVIKIGVSLFIMWYRVGPSALAGMGLCMLLGPLQYLQGKLYRKLRETTTGLTDCRVKVMNEVIAGMRLIKMYAWERPFAELVRAIRATEMGRVKCTMFLRAGNFALYFCTTHLLTFAIVAIYVATGGELKPDKVFIPVMYLNLVRLSITLFVPLAVQNGSEALVSIRRMQEFLLLDEYQPLLPDPTLDDDIVIKLECVVARWPSATDFDDSVSTPRFRGLVSPASVSPHAGIPHAALSPRLSSPFPRSPLVSPFSDKARSSRCSPPRTPRSVDGIRMVLNGVDLTVQRGSLVGIGGAVGSGKTSLLCAMLGELPCEEGSIRVATTPTVFQQEVWIMSGTVRSNILFGKEMDHERYEAVVDACCLESDFDQFENGDMTMVGEKGTTLSGGQRARIGLARACYQGGELFLLDDPLSALDSIVGRQVFDRCICGLLNGATRILISHQQHYFTQCDMVYRMERGVLFPWRFERKDSVSERRKKGPRKIRESGIAIDSLEDRAEGAVTWQTYAAYCKYGAGLPYMVLLVIVFLGAQGVFMFTDLWLAKWADRGTENKENRFHLRWYIVSICVLVVLGLLRSLGFFRMALNASANLHNIVSERVMRFPTTFFDTNPTGRILNRFSKDVGQMDELLPWIFFDFLQLSLLCLGSVVLVALVNVWILAVVGPLLVVFALLRSYFVKSAREIKRLEALHRSPLYNIFSETVSGLYTIRAYQQTEYFEKRYRTVQNDHSSAFFLFLHVNRWLGLRLDLLTWFFGAATTIALLLRRGSMSQGDVAISLAYASSLAGDFQWCVRQSAEVENYMTATERVRSYTKLPIEGARETAPEIGLHTTWPNAGAISFQNYSLRYRSDSPMVLKGITCSIAARHKVGVVGRTGAGKSSLMQGIFRLTEPAGGAILIDGVDTTTVGLETLRSAISAIPQDPVLFTGSLRYNLDPFYSADDDALWSTLEAVQLSEEVDALGGLDYEVSEGGKNFSVGQRQLLCLARAMLRNNRILIMDEATANVDPATDKLIQTTVRTYFKECTVLTIAHRLHTIIDCDRVMVLHQGCLSAFGHPHELLQDKDCLFTKYVEETGAEASARLRETAKASYDLLESRAKYDVPGGGTAKVETPSDHPFVPHPDA